MSKIKNAIINVLSVIEVILMFTLPTASFCLLVWAVLKH